MNRLWSLLFLSVPVMAVVIVSGAAGWWGDFENAWLPPSIGPRTGPIDALFDHLHMILGVVLVITGLTLPWALWRYSEKSPGPASPRRGLVWLELVWTAIPAGILIWLALAQLPLWNRNKVDRPIEYTVETSGERVPRPPLARVVARQFEWVFVYPGDDREFETQDDIISPGLLVVPQDEEVVLQLNSQDVIHSFNVNLLRLKQDVVPGLTGYVWFTVNRTGTWEINCTELCGWGHYRMRGELQALPREEFERWQASVFAKMHR